MNDAPLGTGKYCSTGSGACRATGSHSPITATVTPISAAATNATPNQESSRRVEEVGTSERVVSFVIFWQISLRTQSVPRAPRVVILPPQIQAHAPPRTSPTRIPAAAPFPGRNRKRCHQFRAPQTFFPHLLPRALLDPRKG